RGRRCPSLHARQYNVAVHEVKEHGTLGCGGFLYTRSCGRPNLPSPLVNLVRVHRLQQKPAGPGTLLWRDCRPERDRPLSGPPGRGRHAATPPPIGGRGYRGAVIVRRLSLSLPPCGRGTRHTYERGQNPPSPTQWGRGRGGGGRLPSPTQWRRYGW